MTVKVANMNGHVFMEVTELKDMFTPEQVYQIASQGYIFFVNGVMVASDEVILRATEAYFKEMQQGV